MMREEPKRITGRHISRDIIVNPIMMTLLTYLTCSLVEALINREQGTTINRLRGDLGKETKNKITHRLFSYSWVPSF
jgi:hypothetical protein